MSDEPPTTPDPDEFPPDLSLLPFDDGTEEHPDPVAAAPDAAGAGISPTAAPWAPDPVWEPPVPRPVSTRRRWGKGRLGLVSLLVLAVLSGPAFAAIWLTGTRGSGRPVAVPAESATVSERPAESAPPLASPAGSAQPSRSNPPGQGSGAAGDMVAAEEFSGTAADIARWGIYEDTAANGSTFAASAVRVGGGELQIVGTGKDPTGKGNVSGGLCWCGALGNRTYGKWQVRARFDAGSGYGQIIGLWPQSDSENDGWINVADASQPDKKTVYANVSWFRGGMMSADEGSLAGDFTAWHTYSVEWRATFVKIYVDDTLLYDSTVHGSTVVIPQVPMHLYLKQVVGPDDAVPAANAATPNQVTMHIDWVRIYR